MLAFTSASAAFNAPVLPVTRTPSASMAAIDDLKTLSKELNPVLGYYDPLNLASLDFWGKGDDATIGFLRHSEVKHGRVAMAGFVGYIVHANGIHFPWDPVPGGYVAADSPQALWDSIPEVAKWQIILFVGFLEIYSEHSFILEKYGEKHYMKGGKPGFFPPFDTMVHPCPLNLYDPLKLSSNRLPEAKAKGLVAEINNGRLAMLGLFGFLSEGAIPGSVPALTGVVPTYSGEIMKPFEGPFPFL